ncbi:uncharacterized protein LOC129909981 [Episyrphus balteatus]|uniref:uncharacterized protein LOC129909981 n=1 Tax=Episyrphus balteatus TaxID=286459 RepID=UPI002485C0C7|nr:uncharacterized protein LOC129909981 [Episyrphus balteatus]
MPQSKWILEKVVFGGIVHLDEGLTTIGRNHHSTIVASSDYVSRNHAQIHITPDSNEIRITDLGSKNGIYVNEFQYNNAECILNVGDRIGIGVEVEDSIVSDFPEGKYPIYLLKRLPEEQDNENPPDAVPCNGKVDLPDQKDENVVDETDDEYADEIIGNDDFVMPQARPVAEPATVIIKTEIEPPPLASSKIICQNINDIFGELNSEVLNTLSQETRKIAYTSTIINKPVKPEDVICISSSEDEDCDPVDKRQTKARSPELFNGSFNSDKDSPASIKQNGIQQPDSSATSSTNTNKQSNNIIHHEIHIQKDQQIKPAEKESNKSPENNPSIAEPKSPNTENNLRAANQLETNQIPAEVNLPTENHQSEKDLNDIKDEDFDDDTIFTQKMFEDMKELLEDEDPDFKIESEDSDSIPIKQEIFTQNLDGTIINLDDDDEFDEAFESLTQKWSTMLSKNTFSNSFNASQVYEDVYSDEEPTLTRTSLYIIDDDDDELDFVDRAAMVQVKTEPGITDIDEQVSLPSSDKNKTPARDVRSLQKTLFHSSDEEEEDESDKPTTSAASLNKYGERLILREGEKRNEESSTAAGSLNKFHERVIRRLSTTEEIPTKKPRLSKKSDDDDREHIRRSSSSSHKTYSRKSSGSKRSHSSLSREDSCPKEDLFDKLKEDDKPKHSRKTSSSSSSSHKHSGEHKKSSDKKSHGSHRSSSGNDQIGSSIYKSATVARMNSVKSKSPIDLNDADDFVETKIQKVETTKVNGEAKLPEVPVPVISSSKTILRGPPEIIQPPNLPVHKGKLRGVSATHNRIAEKLKASSDKKDLKRKWLEKPSAKKDKERARAIQEERKIKLKELNDKKLSESGNAATSKKTTTTNAVAAEDKETNRKKLKVKVTQNNRGAFLTEQPPTITPKPHYTIPKKQPVPNGSSSSKISNGSSKSKSPPTGASKKLPEQRKPSSEGVTSFDKELAQADIVLQRQTSRDRAKSTDASNEQKKCAPPRRNSKKVNFAAMTQYNEETESSIRAKRSCMKNLSPSKNSERTRKVTFKLPPEIRYIESSYSAKPKRFQRESSTIRERKSNIRERYPILDRTDILLDDILSWSQLWLRNKQHSVNIMVFPMSNNFKSFADYKNIVLPLLKMEYLGLLEQCMEQNGTKPSIVCEVDYTAPHNHRDFLYAKCNSPIKPSELSFNDLALLEIATGSTWGKYFGYISNVRNCGPSSAITIEIISNAINREILRSKPKIKIRRIIDGIRMHLGTFNAVHQLEHTPLIQKILNPIELLKTDNNNLRLPNIEYKGYHQLNKEQRDILLKAYEKAIDQLNPNVTLINGPPGTGKSLLISNLALQLLYGNEVNELDKKILICAQSNMAVDVIAEKLIRIKAKLTPQTAPFDVIRFGVEEKVHPNVRGITIKGLLQQHRMDVIRKQANQTNGHAQNEENLALEIVQLEARIIEMEKQNFQDVRKEELMEMRKSLAVKKSIANQAFRPEDERRHIKRTLESANIVCCTLSGCIKLSNYLDYFDICIIDEATQCTEPWTLMPLKFGVSNLIMVGDTQQLPATVISQSAKELGLEISLFTRIKKCLENNYTESSTIINQQSQNETIFSLQEQYRMHPEISKWPNMYFYKNQLRNNPKTNEFKSSIKPFSILNLEYRQNDAYYGQVSGQISNKLEAEFVAKLVATLDNYIPNKFYSYGVITPYAHHRETLENMIRISGLKNIIVNTIDSYQGIEKDVIIISNARTHGVGFLGNYQRLNVALTRPKKCLILCGNFKNLESVPSWASLLANAKDRGLYHNISAQEALDIPKNVIEKIKIKR